MIGYLLLIIAIFLYLKNNKKWSLLIFITFCSDGLQILPQSVLGAKPVDLAAIYTVIICLYSCLKEKNHDESDIVKRLFVIFSIFFFTSIFFSYLHYNLSIMQIVQGSRAHWIFFSYIFLRKTKIEDIYWLVNVIVKITIIVATLYVIQVITGLPVLPYSLEVSVDSNTGIQRYYNYPFYLSFCIYLISIFPNIVKLRYRVIDLCILFTALLCTQGRTMIFSVILFLFIGLWIYGKRSKFIKFGIILCIGLLPFSDLILARLGSGDGTSSDIQSILDSSFLDYQVNENVSTGYIGGGTMSYRFAWIYERVDYLSQRPFLEKVFGLGLISDSQTEIVHRLYKFNLGLMNYDTGYRSLITTPDISYGNFITQFGFFGGTIFLLFWLSILIALIKNRKADSIVFCIMLMVLYYFVNSFAGSTMSNAKSLVFPYLALAIIKRVKWNNKIKILK